MKTTEEIVAFFDEEKFTLPNILPSKVVLNRLYDLTSEFNTLAEKNQWEVPGKASDLYDKAFDAIASTDTPADKRARIFDKAIKEITQDFKENKELPTTSKTKSLPKVITTVQAEHIINELRKGKTFTLEGGGNLTFIAELDKKGRKGYYNGGGKVKRDDLYEMLRVTGVVEDI